MNCKCFHAEKNFLGKIGVCWGTKEREACSCGGDEAKCDFYDYVRERAKKLRTNADRIRAMTDEELAGKLSAYSTCMECILLEKCNRMIATKQLTCKDMWLDWLKQEVKE